tara:strand:+ start:21104 stop:22216 length:1113 start_codon:yes stop_codon:yes gene_type:complete
VQIWLFVLLILTTQPLIAGDAEVASDLQSDIDEWHADDPNEPTEHWVDSSHEYAAARAQALTQWMDDYFGEPNYELESADSLIRVDFTTNWDQEDGNTNNVRLRGKLYLPNLSKRLNLVFNDGDGDELDPDSDLRDGGSNLGLVYEVTDGKSSRVDLTLGLRWNRLRPGIRYRYQGHFWDVNSYRLTQRLQWDTKDRLFATSQAEIYRALSKNTILRWNNKAVYGQETDGTEWITRLSLFQRTKTHEGNHRVGINYYGSVKGITDPESYVRNYTVGVLFRRSIFRKFLFLELEPAYHYRKRDPDEKRQFAWSVALRFQIALESNLDGKKYHSPDEDPADDNTSIGSTRIPEETGGPYQAAADPFIPAFSL